MAKARESRRRNALRQLLGVLAERVAKVVSSTVAEQVSKRVVGRAVILGRLLRRRRSTAATRLGEL